MSPTLKFESYSAWSELTEMFMTEVGF